MNRDLATPILRDLDKKIVLLTGPRQVGKTTLAKSLVEGAEYFNFDAPEHRSILRAKHWSRQAPLVIFDELHKMKGWKSWIKGIYDTEGVRPRLLVTGSAKLDVARKMGDSLAGRHFLYRLHPLTLNELHGAMKPEEGLRRLMAYGGFPEPFLENDPEFYARWRRSHLDIILRQDLLDLEQVRQIPAIETLIELLRARVGTPVSYEALARDLEVSATTVKRWTILLENLFVLFRVTPWHRNIARALLKSPKFYFYDNGLVLGDEGARFENLVACALLREAHRREDLQGAKTNLHYLRTKEGREVDFLLVQDGTPRLLLETKWADPEPSKHLAWFAEHFGKAKPATIQIVGKLDREREVIRGPRVVKAAQWLAEMRL